VASSFDPIPKMWRKWEYFESARRRFGSGWLISLKLSCILRQLRQSGPNQLYFDFIPAKKMATLLALLHHLRAPSVSLPFPRIFPRRPSIHTQFVTYHFFPIAIHTAGCREQASKANRFPSHMAVMNTNPDARHEPVSGGMPAPDEDDRLSDTSSLTEISSQEFPTYFVEHDDRLFPSHGGPSYPFPVDGHEQKVRFF